MNFVQGCYPVPPINRMSRPRYKSRYVYKRISRSNKIRLHITCFFVAKSPLVGGKLNDHEWNHLIIKLINNECFLINEDKWHMKPIRTRFPKSMSRDTRTDE